MESSQREHNGYKNYLTFTVAVWIDNNSAVLPWIHRIADIYAREGYSVQRFADWLQEYVDSTLPEDLGDNVGNVYLAVAGDQVNWDELAGKYMNRER